VQLILIARDAYHRIHKAARSAGLLGVSPPSPICPRASSVHPTQTYLRFMHIRYTKIAEIIVRIFSKEKGELDWEARKTGFGDIWKQIID